MLLPASDSPSSLPPSTSEGGSLILISPLLDNGDNIPILSRGWIFRIEMSLLLLFFGVVGLALLLYFMGPKITEGRRYPDERMRQKVTSVDYSAMKPRSRFPKEDRSHKKRWEGFMDDGSDY
ncbi:MAG: hypothetical protein ACFFED_08040 [Candidatus Thorarchaeota archaeon]